MNGMKMEDLYRFKNKQEYQQMLDIVILKNDIQKRSIGNGKIHKYFPIAIIEAIADYVFADWNVIDEKYNKLDNMLICTIKISFTPDYPAADENICTGSAAVLIQSNSKNALEYQLPAVRSEAIGKALGSLGNVFGRNLSRKLNKNTEINNEFSLRPKKKKDE